MTNNLSDFVRDIDGDDVMINEVHTSNLDHLKCKLQYFFMDPIKKWRHRRTRPWKLMIQILKILVFTSQLILFGSDMAKFIDYKEEMQVTLKELLLKNWDPSADAIAYPGPYIPYAVYTKEEFINSINYAVRQYSNISRLSVGPFGYQSDNIDQVSDIDICTTNYIQADFDPTGFKYNYSIATRTRCKAITNFAKAGNESWTDFDFREHLDEPINISSLVAMTMSLPLRTILMEDASTGNPEIVCFNIDLEILWDNRHRNGQITISLISLPTKAECHGSLTGGGPHLALRTMLNITVIIFCLASFTLCMRSLWRSYKLMSLTEKVLYSHGKVLIFRDRLEFADLWLMIIIFNDIMVGCASIIITFSNDQILETDNYTICSLLLGMGNLLSWVGLLRYLSFFRKYNVLIVTLRKSFFHVLRFMICTTIIYCGFCFCGWIVFGPYHFKFRQLSTTTECLFSLINGDDMFETFALLRSDISSIWWFSRIYLYIFVSLFIYVVLSLFIALIMDAYEMIKQYGSNGFPKSRLESLYLDGDLSKLTNAQMSDSQAGGYPRTRLV